MSENNVVSLKVDEAVVSKILEKQIQSAVLLQLGSPEQLIEKVVGAALSDKVDIEGNKSRYQSDNTHDFLEILASKSIRETAKEALKESLNENKEKIKSAVLLELKKPSRQRSIAVAYADAIEKSLTCNWNMSCDIKFKEAER